jgi:AraC-like DNA-binding protein/ligand-binding sensor protein
MLVMSTDSILTQQSRSLVAQLKGSHVFQEYEQAFRETTGLPIALRSIEAFDLPHHEDPKQSPFCALMAQSNKSCAACLQLQRKVEEEARVQPKTLKCFAGLCESAVPVRVGDNLIAFIQTGQVFFSTPDAAGFASATKQLLQFGADVDLERFEEAYFATRVVSKKQYESIIRLLTIFAQHLSVLSNQLMVEDETNGMPSITKARAFIVERHADQLSLSEVARAVNMSAFYFCKTFKKVTGMNFTTYLGRVRVEKVKNLLLDPNRRVSEAAYEAGFQSLSQFNRVFRRIAGESPSVYREGLHGGRQS